MKCRQPSALARGRASASAMVPPSGSPPRMKQNHHLSSRAREAIFRGTDTPDRQKPAGARPWPDRSGRAVDDELISPGRPFFFEKCMASQGRTSQQISHRRPKHDTPLSLPAPHRTRHLADSRWRPPIHQHPQTHAQPNADCLRSFQKHSRTWRPACMQHAIAWPARRGASNEEKDVRLQLVKLACQTEKDGTNPGRGFRLARLLLLVFVNPAATV